MTLLTEVLGFLPLAREWAFEEVLAFWKCLSQILIYSERITVFKELLALSYDTFETILIGFPHERTDCLYVMADIIKKHPGEFMNLFYRK